MDVDSDAEEQDVFRLQFDLQLQWTEEDETAELAATALIVYGLEEVREIRREQRFQRRLYLIRSDLLPNPRLDTPWQRLYTQQNNRAFITTMGFDPATFSAILDAGFCTLWENTPIPRQDVASTAEPRSNRRSLDAAGALGLVLHYLNSTMHDVSLCEIFALIPTTVSRYISFSLRILLETLSHMQGARVRYPRRDEFPGLNALVTARHPLLTGAFGSMDGLNLPVQTSTDQDIENATFNGWLHEHFVSCVFAFAADGEFFSRFLATLLRGTAILTSLHRNYYHLCPQCSG